MVIAVGAVGGGRDLVWLVRSELEVSIGRKGWHGAGWVCGPDHHRRKATEEDLAHRMGSGSQNAPTGKWRDGGGPHCQWDGKETWRAVVGRGRRPQAARDGGDVMRILHNY